MNAMTASSNLTYVHRCAQCQRLFSMPIGRAERCSCGGEFKPDREYAPTAPVCGTCMGLHVFVVAGARLGVKLVPCPDCNPDAVDELAATLTVN